MSLRLSFGPSSIALAKGFEGVRLGGISMVLVAEDICRLLLVLACSTYTSTLALD